MRRAALMAALLATVGNAARADVVTADAHGFELRSSVETTLRPDAAFRRFLAVAKWWSDDHTYSGQARRLRIDARPGGCWCESLPGGGGVQHMTVAYVDAPRALRFLGGLGPLQELAVQGAMTVTFKQQGSGTRVTLVYRVAGQRAGGFAELAPVVDSVLRTQLGRYAAQDTAAGASQR